MNFDLDRLPDNELEAIAKRLLVRAAGKVPGPTDAQVAELLARSAEGRDGTDADIHEIATELDRVHEPGMGGLFRFDAARAVGYLAVAGPRQEVAPGVCRILLRNFAHSVYYTPTPDGPKPLAVLPDARTKLWWHDMPSRGDCAPEDA